MPEPPDFERIARSFIGRRFNIFEPENEATLLADAVRELRQVWNARGAADLEALETESHPASGRDPHVLLDFLSLCGMLRI